MWRPQPQCFIRFPDKHFVYVKTMNNLYGVSHTHQLYQSLRDGHLVVVRQSHCAGCLLCEPCEEQSVDLMKIYKHRAISLSPDSSNKPIIHCHRFNTFSYVQAYL